MSGGLVIGSSNLKGFKYLGILWRRRIGLEVISFSNWHPYLPQPHEIRNPRTKKWGEGKEILWRAWVHIFPWILTQTTYHVWSGFGGLNVEARFFFFFFRSTADEVQNPRNLPKAQSPSGPMVHGSKNIKRNGLQPSIKPIPKEEAQSIQPIDSFQPK